MTDFKKHENVIISGSLVSWGQQWQSAFDLAIFIYLHQASRMKRLEKREVERYGNKLLTDPQTQSNSKAFIDWAAKYDEPAFTGRSLKIHNEWTELLCSPVIRLDGKMELKNKIEKMLVQITIIAKAQE